ncbi:hypothetical protein D1871_09940 [Nakamurella silvestris]|nr:hypothetical protein D1871_09940 [Nakamurella silvestris]
MTDPWDDEEAADTPSAEDEQFEPDENQAEVAAAWESAGRTVEQVTPFIALGLGPQDRERLTGLTDEQAVDWCYAVGWEGTESLDRVVLWRSLGYVVPPEGLYRLSEMAPVEIRRWHEAGFDVPWMIRTQELELTVDEAIGWRDRGHTADLVTAVLRADRSLTVQEYESFLGSTIPQDRQIDWIAHGFDVEQALAFTALGVRANEARVWRSRGLGPADVPPGRHLPQDFEIGGWALGPGDSLRDITHHVTDPAGTRGSIAVRARRPRHDYRDYL